MFGADAVKPVARTRNTNLVHRPSAIQKARLCGAFAPGVAAAQGGTGTAQLDPLL
jgi:hypothetical protein